MSACSFAGLRRRCPRRDRLAGIAWTSGVQRLGVVGVGRRTPTDKGTPARSDSTWIFEPALPQSTGIDGQSSPFIARTDAAPITTRPVDQSRLPSWSSTARCNRRRTTAQVHTVNRRYAVGTVTLNDGGSIRHTQALVSTYTTAVNTARWSIGAVPPLCVRGLNFGSSGSAGAHNSSGHQPAGELDEHDETSCSTTVPDALRASQQRKMR